MRQETGAAAPPKRDYFDYNYLVKKLCQTVSFHSLTSRRRLLLCVLPLKYVVGIIIAAAEDVAFGPFLDVAFSWVKTIQIRIYVEIQAPGNLRHNKNIVNKYNNYYIFNIQIIIIIIQIILII